MRLPDGAADPDGHGEHGLSRLPPDIFKQDGKDDHDNGKTPVPDAKDSIMARGRCMCVSADRGPQVLDSGEITRMTDANGITNRVLELVLAGYDVGMDAVRATKRVPQTNEAQGYVPAVRAGSPSTRASTPRPRAPPPTLRNPPHPSPPPSPAHERDSHGPLEGLHH